MTDVVTGGAGFIGAHLCRLLLSEGRRVRVVDNFSSGKLENLAEVQRDFGANLEVVDQDIRDLGGLVRTFEGAETVFHQAALVSVEASIRDPVESNSVNVEGTLKVLQAARKNQARKVVLASSTAVYGQCPELPTGEETPADPISPYGLTKYVGELYCAMFSRLFGLPTVALRYFNVYGPRQDAASEYAAVIPKFIARMSKGCSPVIFGDGEQTRDFVFVRDVARANLLAAMSDCQGMALNVASGRRISLNQLVVLLNDVLKTSLQPVHTEAREGEVRHSEADFSLARQQIDFQPSVSLRQGLSETAAWFRT